MKGIGCIFMFAVLLALAAEGYVVDLVAHWLGDAMQAGHVEYLGALLLMGLCSFVGWRLVKIRLARLPLVVMGGGDFGRAAVSIVGAALLVFPGFISGAIGLLLQLPPLQVIFGRAAGTVVAALIRQAAQRMGKGGAMPGGFPGGGMPGGFPGGMPGGFPGGMPGGAGPLKPDQQQKGKRIIDVDKEN